MMKMSLILIEKFEKKRWLLGLLELVGQQGQRRLLKSTGKLSLEQQEQFELLELATELERQKSTESLIVLSGMFELLDCWQE